MPDDNGRPPQAPIRPSDYDLEFDIVTPLQYPDPDEYATQIEGRIFLGELPGEEYDYTRMRIPAGRIDLTLYHLARAEHDGQSAFEVFDCESQLALDMYRGLYDCFELKPEVEAVIAPADMMNPTLLVVQAVEVLPQFRGRGLGLAAALKALQLFGPFGGLAAMLATPLHFGLHARNRRRWRRKMKMDEFEKDPKKAAAKLSAYWGRLGFKTVHVTGQRDDSFLQVRGLETPLPTMDEVLSGL